jgi:hypothetical protein
MASRDSRSERIAALTSILELSGVSPVRVDIVSDDGVHREYGALSTRNAPFHFVVDLPASRDVSRLVDRLYGHPVRYRLPDSR